MPPTRLDCAVAHATGEDPHTIARLGFVVLTRGPVEREHAPLTFDWDEHDACGLDHIARSPRRGCYAS